MLQIKSQLVEMKGFALVRKDRQGDRRGGAWRLCIHQILYWFFNNR